MEGNIFVLLLAIVLAFLFALSIIWHYIARWWRNAPAQSKQVAESRFIRENSVSGYLVVDDKQIQTFNTGTLVLDELVSITFYNNFNSPVRITDIELNDISIFSYSQAGMSYREQADYAIQVLKQTANQGKIPRSLVHEVEEIVLDVDALNEHIKAKRIRQIQTATADDFVWAG